MCEAQKATPPEELRRQIMSYTEPKNEREWWALHRIEQLEAALRGLIEAQENQWHPMKINGAEWFTARAALAGEKKDEKK